MSGYEIELPSSPDPLADEAEDSTMALAAPATTAAAAPPPSTIRRPPSTFRRSLVSTAASSRFSALPGTSPRKRMFALDVGSEITPQTIYVTVEAGQDGIIPLATGPGAPSVNRRLFGSPVASSSPRRRIQTTTTTVPLRGLTDDEAEATPKPRKRGRPSLGRVATPSANSANKGRKPRNPTSKESAKKSRETPMSSSDNLQSDTPGPSGQPTPRRRGRPPKRKLTDVPSELGDAENPERSTKKQRGRRRQSIVPDEFARLPAANDVTDDAEVNEDARSRSPDAAAPDSALKPTTANDDNTRAKSAESGAEEQVEEVENDIWMDEVMDNVVSGHKESSPQKDAGDNGEWLNSARSDPPEPFPAFPEDHFDGESDGYAPIMEQDDRSDVESQVFVDRTESDHHQYSELEDQGPLPGESDDAEPILQNGGRQATTRSSVEAGSSRMGDEADKTLDAENFTMIGIDHMSSFKQSRNLSVSDPPEIGEETSFFINKTLESLKEEIAESEGDDDIDVLVSREPSPIEDEPSTRKKKAPSSGKRGRPKRSPAVTSSTRKRGRPRKNRSPAGSIAAEDFAHEKRHLTEAQEDSDGAEEWPEMTGARSDDDDSFSDIPEEALAAAESMEEAQRPSSRAAEDLDVPAKPSPPKDDVHGPGSQSTRDGVNRSSSRPASSHYTPAKGDRTGLDGAYDDVPQRSATQSIRSIRSSGSRRASGSGQQTIQDSSPPHSIRSRSDSNRLLTPPDETSSSERSPERSVASDTAAAIPDHMRDLGSDDIGSSPPDMTNFEQIEPPALPSRRNSDTPANREPLANAQQPKERPLFPIFAPPSHLSGPRPALSPVVRIGRTLQNILSDPPSPSGRSSVLGSPFKGSVRNSSPLDGAAVDEALQNVASADDSLPNSIPQAAANPGSNTVQQSTKPWAMALAPLSQIKNLVSQGAQLFTSPNVDRPEGSDSFGPSSPSISKDPDNKRNTTFLERIKQASREGSAHSNRIASRNSDDDNSERIVHRANDIFNRPSASSNPPLANQDSFLSRSRQPAEVTADLDETEDELYMDDADDSRPQLKETQEPGQPSADTVEEARGPSRADDQQNLPAVMDQSDQAGQSKAEDNVQSDEIVATEEQSDEEDIWTIEANRTASSPRYPDLPDESFNSFRKSGLSIDWGTRSTSTLRNSQSAAGPAFKSGRGSVMNPPEDLEDYSLVDVHSGTSTQPSAKKPTPQVPKQSKRVDLSDFFSSSPNFLERQRRAKEASLAKANAAAQPPPVDNTHIASTSKTGSILRPSPSPSMSEAASPERGTSNRLNREPGSSTSFNVSPERNSSPRIPQQDFAPRHDANDAKLFETWTVSSQMAISEPGSASPDMPRVTIERPDDTNLRLRQESEAEEEDWPVGTPEQLRPLPGRAASPSKSCLRSPLKPKRLGRVVDFTSSAISVSPQPSPRRQPQTLKPLPQQHQRQKLETNTDSPLSQTQWSRKHWLFLDSLLQAYRQSPLEFQLRHSNTVMASPQHKRPSSRLLGKHVTSQGETLVLEQWHLDVTDCFVKEVGGWSEDVVAKRLFALIVGEERRQLGQVPKRR